MTAIRAEALAKSYLVRTERRRTLKELLLRQYAPHWWFVPHGRLRAVLHDLRAGSPTAGNTLEYDWSAP